MKLTEKSLREMVKEEVGSIQPQHFGMSGDPTDDDILDFAKNILNDPDSLSVEEKDALRKLLRHRAERTRRDIERKGYSRDPERGAYASLRKSMVDVARDIK